LPGDDGNDAERAALERKHAARIYDAFRAVLLKVAPANTTVRNVTVDKAIDRWRDNRGIVRDALVDMLTDGAVLGADVGRQQVETILGVGKAPIVIDGVDWDMINVNALQWVTGGGQLGQGFGQGYANALLETMTATTETGLRTIFGEWINNNLSYGQLVHQLDRAVFGRTRAEMIATTEITRAYAEGNRHSWIGSRVIKRMRWQSVGDELVCPICGPRNQTIAELDRDFGGYFPPAHPRCRCWVTPVPIVDGFDQTAYEPAPAERQSALRERINQRTVQQSVMPVTPRPAISKQKLMYEWVHGSNRKTSIMLKEAIKQEFNMPGLVMNKRGFQIAQSEIDDVRSTIRDMYDQTQQSFKDRGVETVTLYRGVKSNVRIPGVVESWTTDLATAKKFNGYDIMKMEVSIDRIFMHSGGPGWKNGKYGEQYEYMVMANKPGGL